MSTSNPSITVIGTGAVGGALIDFFQSSSYKLLSVWNRDGGVVFDSEGSRKIVSNTIPESGDQIGELLILALPDDMISPVASELAKRQLKWDLKSVIHCSGNMSSDVLKPLADCGCLTASMHPIQTFKRGDRSERFRDIFISLEGDEQLLNILEDLTKQLGSRFLKLNPEQKSMLHVAAVFSSNYLVALLHQVEQILEKADLTDGIQLLEPLIHQTIQNIHQKGTVDALTGPISRGDVKSVEKHINQLERDQTSLHTYKLLGEIAVTITEKRGDISAEKIRQIRTILSSADPKN
ncbi:MAG: DUF2520 domain-containing protein [Balneolaceae bacterium]|nr:DUF2520 domain-containing protein [Balneolaceae bacterium]